MEKKNKVELLAPAGNMTGFYGAIHAGADAVYLGGSRFGARAYADNFTEEELITCIRYAHMLGKKVYLTVNTLIKETEMEALYGYLLPYYEAGLDAVIVQDIGAFRYIQKHFPKLSLHVSTQMTVTGKYGAALLESIGAERIVPARELSLAEISKIKETTRLELECFIHGAMCYCYSGQCLFSSILGGRSGNRGRCAQPCRLPYKVNDQKNIAKECYPLSLKDMCTIEHLPLLIEAGIDSFKIEGRMKKPEYAAGVTAIYRKYIDQYYDCLSKQEGLTNWKIDSADIHALSSLYIRSEKQDGYYFKHNGRDMITLQNPSYAGSDEELLNNIRQKYLETAPKITLDMSASFYVGEPATLKLTLKEYDITHIVTGDLVDEAKKNPVTEENISKQLSKLGGSHFQLGDLVIEAGNNIFIPLKAINELRRKAVMEMEDALIAKHTAPAKPALQNQPLQDTPVKSPETGRLFLSFQSFAQLKAFYTGYIKDAVGLEKIKKIYINSDLLFSKFKNDTLVICKELCDTCELVLALPYILRENDSGYLEQLIKLSQEYDLIFSGFLVRSLEGMGFLLNHQYGGRIYADAGFYHWNNETIQFWQKQLSGFTLPFELKEGEQQKLLKTKVACEKVLYGRIPMMLTANCVEKTTKSCIKDTTGTLNVRQILDRYQKKFPIELNCMHCMNIIYNSVPLSLHGQAAKWKQLTDLRLNFTIESPDEVIQIIKFFTATIYNKTMPELPYKEYTTGHEKRGVE